MTAITCHQHGTASFSIDARGYGLEVALVELETSTMVIGGIPDHSKRGAHGCAYQDVPTSSAKLPDVGIAALIQGSDPWPR